MPATLVRMVGPQPLRLRRALDFEEVRWASVMQLMVRRHKRPFRDVDRLLRTFFRRLRTPFHPRWFFFPELNLDENRICQAICEAHGADRVTLTRRLSIGPSKLVEYRLVLDLEPDFRTDLRVGGRVGATCEVRIRRKTMEVSSPLVVAVIGLAAVVVLVVSYAIIAAALLYAVAVLAVFVQDPVATFVAATRSLPLGLGLLCALVTVGAFFGHLGRSLLKAFRSAVRWTSLEHRAPPNEEVPRTSEETSTP